MVKIKKNIFKRSFLLLLLISLVLFAYLGSVQAVEKDKVLFHDDLNVFCNLDNVNQFSVEGNEEYGLFIFFKSDDNNFKWFLDKEYSKEKVEYVTGKIFEFMKSDEYILDVTSLTK